MITALKALSTRCLHAITVVMTAPHFADKMKTKQVKLAKKISSSQKDITHFYFFIP